MRELFILGLILSSSIVAKTVMTSVIDTNLTIKDKNISIKVEDSTFDYKLKPKKVTESIWCFFGALEEINATNGGNIINSCFIKSKNSFIVIDSGPSYQYAEQSYKAMSKIASLPVKSVISTHNHLYHWLGNSFYKDKFNAIIIGPESINRNYRDGDVTENFHLLPKNITKGTKIIPVDITPLKAIDINIDGEELEIIPIGQKAHSEEDLFIYLPKKKVIFAGDLAMNGRIASNSDGSLVGELKAISMMRSKDWNILIAGHGLNTDKHALDDTEKYFTLLQKRLLKAIDDEVEAEDITSKVKMDEFKDMLMFDKFNAKNISDAFTEIEFAEE